MSAPAISAMLPTNTYGSNPHLHCQHAPQYHKPAEGGSSSSPLVGICLGSKKHVKASQGHVFYTAYCKHWSKLQATGGQLDEPQGDMCDSFCFLEWALQKEAPPSRIQARNVSIHRDSDVVCLTSEDCNWTNQPTVYKRSWFLEEISAPCTGNPSACVGKPGRISAVRQEQFYRKHPEHWAQKRFRVCLSRGIFYHNEVDNRE